MNPVITVGTQVAEPVELHQHMNKQDAMQKVIEILKSVKIPLPHERAKEYPHEFSGGMRQRAMIAMGLICMPSLIIVDDVTKHPIGCKRRLGIATQDAKAQPLTECMRLKISIVSRMADLTFPRSTISLFCIGTCTINSS
ncbi:MAG: ABC-type dipeptide/oligopeptide/nickel transport system, ATPase component [Candidatus Methanomarinus sp.]|nr:ABC-type dipeptide/oligopeptide/nickel transport system, ATPase component [ANME-2 cluster archaeon]KAF5428220.1 MAG: ABC-type dipeptide/oligopeptide/nickel transport system, ATPase component [ANME-2 cluster archaeon]